MPFLLTERTILLPPDIQLVECPVDVTDLCEQVFTLNEAMLSYTA